ncbi:MAG: hypothetical protein ACRDBG_06650 [Waterburya sp.]
MKLIINITKEELLQAAENFINDQLDEDTFADLNAIANIIKNHLEVTIENIICNPEDYLNPEEKEQANKYVYLTDHAYRKMMDRDIPYPPV